jgi:putative transcriptional regulator
MFRFDSKREKGSEGCTPAGASYTGNGANKTQGETVIAKTKRNLFSELKEGVAAMKEQRKGKLTLRNYNVKSAPLPQVDAKLIKETRENLHCSRAVFSRKLRANERTLEKWEQGRSVEV